MFLARAALALTLLGSLALPVQAAVYKYIDKNGNLVLTDEKVPGAVLVEERPIMTMPFPKGTPAKPADAKKAAEAAAAVPKDYQITIASPGPNTTFQRNSEETVPLAVSVEPRLHGNHRLLILLDGKPVEGDAISLATMDRGTHVLGTQVVDSSGVVFKQGPSVTFYVQQPTVLGPTRVKPK